MNHQHLKLSIAVLAAIGIFAALALAVEGNWAKALRVGLAIAVYSTVLLLATRGESKKGISPLIFLLAAGLAETVSGWLRPDATHPIEFPMVVAATLIGFAHWLGLYVSSLLRNRLITRR